MKVLLSRIFFWMGDSVYRLLGSFGFGGWAYQRLMKISVDLDKHGDVWAFRPSKRKFGKWKTAPFGKKKKK